MLDYTYYNTSAIPRRIKQAMKIQGMKRQTLAERMGYQNANSISQYLVEYPSGKGRVPGLDTLCKFANALHCDIEYLLGTIDTLHKAAADICKATGITNEAAEKLIYYIKNEMNVCSNFISSVIMYGRFLELADEWSLLHENIANAKAYEEDFLGQAKDHKTRIIHEMVLERYKSEKPDVNEFRLRKEFENYIRIERKKAGEKKKNL